MQRQERAWAFSVPSLRLHPDPVRSPRSCPVPLRPTVSRWRHSPVQEIRAFGGTDDLRMRREVSRVSDSLSSTRRVPIWSSQKAFRDR